MKRALLLLILIAPIPVAAGNLFPTECGDLRRENHNVNPSPLQNPIQVQWMTSPNLNLGVPCSNPVVLSDRVVQAFWQGMRCYDRTTGKILWTWVCNSYTNLWNAPAYDADRNLLYQGCNNGDTVALDPQTGNVVWVFNHDPNSITNQIATPLYVNGLLYVGNGGSAFLCLNPDTRAVVWSFNFSSYFGKPFNDATLTPAYDNGSIYLATENGHLFSLNGTTGAVQWYVKQNLIHQNWPPSLGRVHLRPGQFKPGGMPQPDGRFPRLDHRYPCVRGDHQRLFGTLRGHPGRSRGFLAGLGPQPLQRCDGLVHYLDGQLRAQQSARGLRQGLYSRMSRGLLLPGRPNGPNRLEVPPLGGFDLRRLGGGGRPVVREQ